MTTYSDPIVEEVREAGAQLAEKAGYDIHVFFDLLREAEKGYRKPLVQKPVSASGSHIQLEKPSRP